MIVFKPTTVTTLNISINTKEDADLLRALALCASVRLTNLQRIDPMVQFLGVDNPVAYKDLDNLIEEILRLTTYYSKEFKNE